MAKKTETAAQHSEVLQLDPWQQLKAFTRARIAIGRVGSSLPTKEVLNFGLSHAMARDAVHLALDIDALESDIQAQGFFTVRAKSMAPDRASYLLRPDWGAGWMSKVFQVYKIYIRHMLNLNQLIF